MFTFNNQPILDQTALFQDEDYKLIDREIMFGLAKSKNIFLSPGYELTRGDAELELYNHSFKDVGTAENEINDEERAEFSKLSFNERHRYLRFAKGAYHPWSVCLPLTLNSEWRDKMLPEGKRPTEEASQLFPQTLAKLYSLKIFESIGRICIFGVDPNQHVTCHRDLDPDQWRLNDELLMISPRGDKKFYVYDPTNKKKHFVDASTKAYIFHDLNYHGCDPLPYFTYTIRIDGIYTELFRSTLSCNRAAVHPEQYLKWKASQR